MKLWIAFLLALSVLPAQAEIYKCRLPNGQTEISNSPCASTSGTITVRPDEKVSAENRRQAERDVERMEQYLEKSEARQLADQAAERERRVKENQGAAQQRVYESANMADCLRELGQLSINDQRRAELEDICRAKAKQEPTIVGVPVPVPAYGGTGSDHGVNICIQNVLRLQLSPAQQKQRLALCQGVYTPPPETGPQPRPDRRTQPENRPGRPCPPNDKFCVR